MDVKHTDGLWMAGNFKESPYLGVYNCGKLVAVVTPSIVGQELSPPGTGSWFSPIKAQFFDRWLSVEEITEIAASWCESI